MSLTISRYIDNPNQPQWLNDRLAGRNPTFHPFARLPSELRLKIWKLTFQPQTHHLYATQPDEEFGPLTQNQARQDIIYRQPDRRWLVPYSVPTAEGSYVLNIFGSVVTSFVCFESRQVYQEYYKIYYLPTKEYGIEMNLEIDTLEFDNPAEYFERLVLQRPEFVEKIQLLHFQTLSVDPTDGITPHFGLGFRFPYDWTALKSLREFSFVVNQRGYHDSEPIMTPVEYQRFKISLVEAVAAKTWESSKLPILSMLMRELEIEPESTDNEKQSPEYADDKDYYTKFVYRTPVSFQHGKYGRVKGETAATFNFPDQYRVTWFPNVLSDILETKQNETFLALIGVVEGHELVKQVYAAERKRDNPESSVEVLFDSTAEQGTVTEDSSTEEAVAEMSALAL